MSPIALLSPARVWIACGFFALLIPAAATATGTPIDVELPPDGQGAAFVPGTRALPADYVEEEFFVSGLADLFNYANNPPTGPTDLVEIG